MLRATGKGTLLEAFTIPAPNPRRRALEPFETDAEMDRYMKRQSCQQCPAKDLKVFGYGSMMWNPGNGRDSKTAVALRSKDGTGVVFGMMLDDRARQRSTRHGAMLRAGTGRRCLGWCSAAGADKVAGRDACLWRSEMLAAPTTTRWVKARVGGGPLSRHSPRANRHNERIPRRPDRSHGCLSKPIRTGKEPPTDRTSRAVFRSTLQALERLRNPRTRDGAGCGGRSVLRDQGSIGKSGRSNGTRSLTPRRRVFRTAAGSPATVIRRRCKREHSAQSQAPRGGTRRRRCAGAFADFDARHVTASSNCTQCACRALSDGRGARPVLRGAPPRDAHRPPGPTRRSLSGRSRCEVER